MSTPVILALTAGEPAGIGPELCLQLATEARDAVLLLNQQIASLRTQLASIQTVLEASEANEVENQTMIADLGRRLNAALAAKVGELQKYRSEFFGRLRKALGHRRPDPPRSAGDQRDPALETQKGVQKGVRALFSVL